MLLTEYINRMVCVAIPLKQGLIFNVTVIAIVLLLIVAIPLKQGLIFNSYT